MYRGRNRWLAGLLFTCCCALGLGAAAPGRQRNIAVSAIFLNEGPWLREWVAFHRLQGVEHFFLYDNGSEDHPEEVLADYLAEGVVEIKPWPTLGTSRADWLRTQAGAYMDAVELARGRFVWLAMLDIDEFLFCPNGTPLPTFLERYSHYPGVVVPWVVFGHSNVNSIPPDRCMVECLTHTTQFFFHGIKPIGRVSEIVGTSGAHRFLYQRGRLPVDAFGRPVKGESSPQAPRNALRIHHYMFRTRDWLRQVKLPRLQRNHRRDPQYLADIHARLEEDSSSYPQDRAILPFVPALRAALGLDSAESVASLPLP